MTSGNTKHIVVRKNRNSSVFRGSFLHCGLLVVFLVLASLSCHAQYRSSIGVRLGVTNGISYKAFVKPRQAVEVMATTSWNGIKVAGFWLWHTNFTEPLQINTGVFDGYLSLGVHYGQYGAESPLYEGNGGGLDAGMGFEYRFDHIPFSLGIDYHFIGDVPFQGGSPIVTGDLGLNLRYLFR